MFRQLKNIDSAFKHIRLFSFVLIAANLLLCSYVIYACLTTMQQDRKRVYVLANGKLLQAVAIDRADNIKVELRDHIKMFHHYFFTLDPDPAVIQKNVSKALYLADASARRQYGNLKEGGYYAGIISGNITQRITMDSITLNINKSPYTFHYYGKLRIVRPTTKVIRSIITEGALRKTSRSNNNPHGFLIERWKILENKDLKVIHRNY